MIVEGNCCWEVYRRRRHMVSLFESLEKINIFSTFQSTVTWMSASDGLVTLDHPVRSVLKKECYEI